MTIQSYLIYPETGQAPGVLEALRALPGCSDVIPAENRELMVLVTETASADEQRALEDSLETLDGVACLAMVGGWSE